MDNEFVMIETEKLNPIDFFISIHYFHHTRGIYPPSHFWLFLSRLLLSLTLRFSLFSFLFLSLFSVSLSLKSSMAPTQNLTFSLFISLIWEQKKHKPLYTGKSISKFHLYILNSEFLGFQFFGVHCLPWLILLFSLNPKQPTCDPPEIWTHRLKQFKNDSRSESSARLKDPIFSDWVTSHAQTRPDPIRAYP